MLLFLQAHSSLFAQHTVARQWNEAMVFAIRNDFARPTVHARNLFHGSLAMYDAWAAYDPLADNYMLGRTLNGMQIPFNGIAIPANVDSAQRTAISHAAYNFIRFRFANSPGVAAITNYIDSLMIDLGYDPSDLSTDYSTGSPVALGNHIAEWVVNMGLSDGSNEVGDYANLIYDEVNIALIPFVPGNANMSDPDHWQPLTFNVYVDQSGHVWPNITPDFLSPEWGNVHGFALTPNELTVHDSVWNVYHDPGPPPHLITNADSLSAASYKWGFELVANWSSHMDPSDGVMWDISPGGIGGITSFPDPHDLNAMKAFYNSHDGGDGSTGHALNPSTGLPYAPNVVPRGDYARVLAEFWADGPDSETPPGHWFVILNTVMDHPLFERKWKGVGPVLDDLEYDVKAYFTLAGTMHDAAISSWSVKGWYDYPRPISILRWMADNGQSTDSSMVNYHPYGIALDPGFIELVMPGDTLEGDSLQHLGKVKFKAWLGPDSIGHPDTTTYGVGWKLAENWWPYQRPTFVTPPFAGYVSGHSTFSRAAAEVLTLMTGDEYFPGGMGEFDAPADQFLVFEDGPSVDVDLQWATYRDASDQCSLSRIWGGIHPPCDDIPGRMMGLVIGPAAFSLAELYFNGMTIPTDVEGLRASASELLLFPIPVMKGTTELFIQTAHEVQNVNLFDVQGRSFSIALGSMGNGRYRLSLPILPAAVYLLRTNTSAGVFSERMVVVE